MPGSSSTTRTSGPVACGAAGRFMASGGAGRNYPQLPGLPCKAPHLHEASICHARRLKLGAVQSSHRHRTPRPGFTPANVTPRVLLPSPIPRPLRLGLAAAAIAFLAGCSAPDIRRPEAPALPATWTSSVPDGAAAAPEFRAWWKAFHDPALDALVDEALQKNLDLAIAAHRLREARLQAGRAAVQFRPSFGAGARTLQDIEATDSYFHASIDMVWELGLFGAAESARASATADRDAAVADGQGARVAVVAEVVRNYLDLQAARRQLQAARPAGGPRRAGRPSGGGAPPHLDRRHRRGGLGRHAARPHPCGTRRARTGARTRRPVAGRAAGPRGTGPGLERSRPRPGAHPGALRVLGAARRPAAHASGRAGRGSGRAQGRRRSGHGPLRAVPAHRHHRLAAVRLQHHAQPPHHQRQRACHRPHHRHPALRLGTPSHAGGRAAGGAAGRGADLPAHGARRRRRSRGRPLRPGGPAEPGGCARGGAARARRARACRQRPGPARPGQRVRRTRRAARGPAGRSRMGDGPGRALPGLRRAVQGTGRRAAAPASADDGEAQ